MNKVTSSKTPFEIEEEVRRYFEYPKAPKRIEDRLEDQLRSQHAELLGANTSRLQVTARIRRLFAPLTSRPVLSLGLLTAVVLLTALLWIGPTRVLAEVERLLSYVPGVGFVNMQNTRVLASPVLITRQGVSVQVDQVIASSENTTVLLSFSGLQAADPQSANAMDVDFQAALVLPDGSRLEAKSWSLDPSGASVVCAPLPQGIYRMTLELNRLPFHKAGSYPENWQIELALQDASGGLPASLFPQPYSPENAMAGANGVTVTVLQVAQAKEETAVQIQTQWQEPNWFTPMTVEPFMSLEDDQGLQYSQAMLSASSSGVAVVGVVPGEPVGTGAAPANIVDTQTLHFAPLSLSAQQVTMTLRELSFNAVTQESFSINLGQTPTVGDHWQLDLPLNVAGLPIQLTNASVGDETQGNSSGPQRRKALVLDFNFPTEENRTISGIDLRAQGTSLSGASGSYDLHGHYTAVLFFETLPTGTLALTINQAQLNVKGPWIFHWQVPGQANHGAARQTAPRHIYPQQVQAAKNGLTMRLDKVVLNDRVSTLELSAPGLEQGWRFFNLGSSRLENQWGQMVNWPQSVVLEESAESTDSGSWIPRPNTISYGPLPPLSSRLILTLDSVDLFHPALAAIDVEVPAGLTFAVEQFPVTEIGAGLGEHQAMGRQLVTQAWPIDLTMDLSGYGIHYTQARLAKIGDSSTSPTWLALTGDPVNADQDGKIITQLRLSSLSRPDGSFLTSDPAQQDAYAENLAGSGWIGKQPGSDVPQAFLNVPVSERMREVLPGIYHIEFGGVVVTVTGPWQLSFDVSGR